jgi:integrase
MLISQADGQPLFQPTLFTITQLRAIGRTAATIEQALRAIAVLLTAVTKLGIDLEGRFKEKKLLTLGELDGLIDFCALTMASIDQYDIKGTPQWKREAGTLQLHSSKMPLKYIGSGSATVRILYIKKYLEWRVQGEVLRAEVGAGSNFATTAKTFLKALSTRSSYVGHREGESERHGLELSERAQILSAIDPDSQLNPWREKRARQRNEVIVRWLYDLGPRAGELLGIRTTDIDFQSCEVRILKRPHDVEDPRRRKPNVKTRGRLLPLDEELVELTRKYIKEVRGKYSGAKRHSFLFVALGSGAPMSLSALNKLFVVLRSRVPDLPEKLSPHVLRHNWNDMFSEMMDAKGIPEAREEKWRSRLMGWTENSGSASVYTKRHVQRKAAEASLAMQARTRRGST